MDRLEEFKEIIEKIQIEKKEKEFGENEPILRNRNSSKKPEFSEIDEANLELFNFSKTFLSECSLIVTAQKYTSICLYLSLSHLLIRILL